MEFREKMKRGDEDVTERFQLLMTNLRLSREAAKQEQEGSNQLKALTPSNRSDLCSLTFFPNTSSYAFDSGTLMVGFCCTSRNV